MKKIISLFKRDYEGSRQVYNEIVSGAEWVIAGEGVATVKFDGTCCMVRAGKLYKRYDRKLTKANARRLKRNKFYAPLPEDYKPAPPGWEAAEEYPNHHTGHWPGWVPVGDKPEDQWHREAWDNFKIMVAQGYVNTGTFELVGPKIQGNPYGLDGHVLWHHGATFAFDPPRDFEGLKEWLTTTQNIEGIVWHHPDGRMVKIKRRDFGLDWPSK